MPDDPTTTPPAPPGVTEPPAPQGNPPPPEDKGFPPNTPVASMTPEQQAAYYKHEAKKAQKLEKERVAAAEQAAAKVRQELDEARRAQMDDQARALDDARKAGESDAVKRYAGMIVTEAFRGLLAARGIVGVDGQPDDARIDILVKALSPDGRYLKEDGHVDRDALAALVDAIAPQQVQPPAQVASPGLTAGSRFAISGQGHTGTPPSAGDARARAQERAAKLLGKTTTGANAPAT